jgi:hypothetical protein
MPSGLAMSWPQYRGPTLWFYFDHESDYSFVNVAGRRASFWLDFRWWTPRCGVRTSQRDVSHYLGGFYSSERGFCIGI